MNEELQKLTDLLEQALDIYTEDRKLAIDNYGQLRKQLDNITHGLGLEQSEDGKIEAEVNKALKLVFDSGSRLDSVIRVITRILIQQLDANNKKEVAGILTGKLTLAGEIIDQPVDVKKLLNR